MNNYMERSRVKVKVMFRRVVQNHQFCIRVKYGARKNTRWELCEGQTSMERGLSPEHFNARKRAEDFMLTLGLNESIDQ